MIAVAVVEMIESEAGWGQRPDGFVAFPSEDLAKAYITKQTSGYTGPAPDVYVRYHFIGIRECSADFNSALTDKGLYVDKLHEMLWTKELRAQKYVT